MQITEPANHVFGPAHFQQSSTDLVRTRPDFFNHGGKRDSVGPEFLGIDVDLILANKPSNRRYFSNTGNRFELVTQIPVLKAAQVGQASLPAVIHKSVLIDPSGPSGIRSDNGMNCFGQPA